MTLEHEPHHITVTAVSDNPSLVNVHTDQAALSITEPQPPDIPN